MRHVRKVLNKLNCNTNISKIVLALLLLFNLSEICSADTAMPPPPQPLPGVHVDTFGGGVNFDNPPPFSQFQTCQRDYAMGIYVCANFANDFKDECASYGIKSWVLTYGFDGPNLMVPQECRSGHALNIVEKNINNNAYRFCVIEPQGGSEIECWYSISETPTVPEGLLALLYAHLGDAYRTCFATLNPSYRWAQIEPDYSNACPRN